jgi:hypothetical protein
MSSHLLDTHKYVKKFIEKGFNEEQSEAIIDFVSEFNDEKSKYLATKWDIEKSEERIKTLILESKLSLIKWIIPLFLTNIVAIIMVLMKMS